MVRRIVLGLLLALLAGCAQIGTLTGGEKDINAPQVVKQDLEQGSTNFHGNSISIEFNEYFKLNNPAQNITMIPNDAKVNASYKKKVLTLDWVEQLKENTTYIIQLNHLVQDITEGNDSLMQIVFSTGPVIDSMTYSCSVQDVKGLPLPKSLVVGLFQYPDSLKPIYYTSVNKNGAAELAYIKEGEYYARSFNDENKNLKIDENEAVGFKEHPIVLNEKDSVPLYLFKPLEKARLSIVEFVPPGLVKLSANRPIDDAYISILNPYASSHSISSGEMRLITPDSLHIAVVRFDTTGNYVISARTDELVDSLRFRVSSKQLAINAYEPTPERTNLKPGEPFQFFVPDIIREFNEAKIQGYVNDSVLVPLELNFDLNLVSIKFSDTISNLKIIVGDSTIRGFSNAYSIGKEFSIQKKLANQLGTLNVNLTQYTEPIVLQVYKSNKLEQSIVSTGEIIQLKQLEPGDYSFKVILDRNNNGRWDTGDFTTKRQPEEIHTFSESTKVRANWEVDVELIPKSKRGE